MVDVILGLQWGDEGKGKIVDFFAPNYDIIARFQGGPNAGHTLYLNDRKIVLHQIPSGIFHEQTVNLIGNGTLALLRNRAQLEVLRDDPTLDANAVEELLRYDSPVQMSRRITLRETEIAGTMI